jgi:hypothetical protein
MNPAPLIYSLVTINLLTSVSLRYYYILAASEEVLSQYSLTLIFLISTTADLPDVYQDKWINI